MKKRTKVWLGVGAFVMAGSGAVIETGPHIAQARSLGSDVLAAPATATATDTAIPRTGAGIVLAQQGARGGQGGEAGERGEGGEAGINVAAADNDPVEYGIALQVIAAHYYAGLAAYEAKETEAGAQMFAHGLSEVYAEMEDIFRRRGVATLGEKLEAAVNAASSKLPAAEVRRRVQDVLKAIAAAEKAGPVSSASALAVKAEVIANLLDRASLQYRTSLDDKNLEPYLDGLGFALAARTEAAKVLPQLRRVDGKKATAISNALKAAIKAYPGIHRPGTPKVSPDQFIAAASSAKLAVSNWK